MEEEEFTVGHEDLIGAAYNVYLANPYVEYRLGRLFDLCVTLWKVGVINDQEVVEILSLRNGAICWMNSPGRGKWIKLEEYLTKIDVLLLNFLARLPMRVFRYAIEKQEEKETLPIVDLMKALSKKREGGEENGSERRV
ncbi:MAG: hypothetical protein DRO05_02680 [Thermoproteota archaeon]|nr:MAG: hypothetical protein DRO05_02680 [Candidatus Korarchaeota archaeon]